MKVAIAADGHQVSPHFGRCSSYTIIEVKGGEVINREEIPNPGHRPGFLPEYLARHGVNCIIAGGMGPRAQSLFSQHNIQTLTGVQGSIEEVIDKFVRQELKAGKDLCNHHSQEHHQPCAHHDEKTAISSGDKIAVTAQGDNLEAEIDPRFGRSPYFIIIDPQTLDYQAHANPYRELSQGAGIQSAQLLAQQGVRLLLTGECGPKASQVLQASGIRVVTGVSGSVQETINKYLKEKTNEYPG